jgi:hypothetical protein
VTPAHVEAADDAPYPRIVAVRGEAPPQYPGYEDEEIDDVA